MEKYLWRAARYIFKCHPASMSTCFRHTMRLDLSHRNLHLRESPVKSIWGGYSSEEF